MYDGLCRLCFSSSKHLIDGSNDHLRNIIQDLFSFTVQSTDPSKMICNECVSIIENFYLFYLKVNDVQKELTKHLEKSNYNKNNLNEVDAIYLNTKSELIKENINDEKLIESKVIYKSVSNSSSLNKNIPNCKNHKIKVDNKDGTNESTDNFTECIPTEIIKNGKLILKGPRLEKLIKKMYNLDCNICNEKNFTRLSNLFIHYESVHKTKGYVICCGESFATRRSIYCHMARHIQPSAFECPICKKTLTRPQAIKTHLKTHYSDEEKPYKCSQCEKRFIHKTRLIHHENSHIPIDQKIKYHCKECGKTKFSSLSYREHVKRVHLAQKQICAKCGKKFKTKKSITYHMLTHDPDGKNEVRCIECGVIIFVESSCKNHITLYLHTRAKHGGKKLQCSQCSYSTPYQHLFKQHIIVKHSNVKPYICDFCGKEFKLKSILNVHLNKHINE